MNFEPFKIKVVEHIPLTTREFREQKLREAHYNLFLLRSDYITIDLLTDSGTGAMSSKQWSAFMDGDEAYAGSRSFYKFEEVVRNITGFKHVIPTHQGRAAERILFSFLGGKGKYIPSNTHFDTTRANIEYSGAEALDFPTSIAFETDKVADFKGNIDLDKLEEFLKSHPREEVPLVMITVTNNSGGGQPVSMENIRGASEIAHKYGVPFFIDCCRFAENAYFIKKREKGYEKKIYSGNCSRNVFLCGWLFDERQKRWFVQHWWVPCNEHRRDCRKGESFVDYWRRVYYLRWTCSPRP